MRAKRRAAVAGAGTRWWRVARETAAFGRAALRVVRLDAEAADDPIRISELRRTPAKDRPIASAGYAGATRSRTRREGLTGARDALAALAGADPELDRQRSGLGEVASGERPTSAFGSTGRVTGAPHATPHPATSSSLSDTSTPSVRAAWRKRGPMMAYGITSTGPLARAPRFLRNRADGDRGHSLRTRGKFAEEKGFEPLDSGRRRRFSKPLP